MGLILYLFGAAIFVIFVGWAIYVLPTPGPLSPIELAQGMIPALVLIIGLLMLVGLVALSMRAARAILHLLRRTRRS